MPELLPDELLYSFIGRIGALNAMGCSRERMRIFFGTDNVIPVMDLPTRLGHLHAVLGTLSPWKTSLDAIDQATLFPYHRPFIPLQRSATIEKILLGDAGGKSLKTLLGRVANRFGAAPELRYCSACLEADTHRYGVPYWHCAHQLPGVTVCLIHSQALVRYSMTSRGTYRQRVSLPPPCSLEDSTLPVPHPNQIAFATLSNELFSARLPALGDSCQRAYREVALDSGFRRRGKIDHPALCTALQAHYKDFTGFPHRDRLMATARNPLSWVRNLIERPERASHPICHLLLIGFLFGSVDEFEASILDESTGPSGKPAVLMPVSLSKSPPPEHQALLQDVTLSCREVARLTNRSVTTIVQYRRILGVKISERPKNNSPDTTKQILEMLYEDMAPAQIAASLPVSLSTVYRLRAQTPGLAELINAKRYERERNEHRQRWNDLVLKCGILGTKKIRAECPSNFAWLYRNDREWLRAACEDLRVRRTPHNRVDWAARDEKFCSTLRAHIENVRCRPERPRISRTLMMRQLGDATVRRNLSKLPKLAALLDELEETQMAYQCARIKLAIEALSDEGQPLLCWRIHRRANLRNWTALHTQYTFQILKEQTDTIRGI